MFLSRFSFFFAFLDYRPFTLLEGLQPATSYHIKKENHTITGLVKMDLPEKI